MFASLNIFIYDNRLPILMFKVPKVEDVEFYIQKNFKAMEDFAAKKREEIEERYARNPVLKAKEKEIRILDKRKDLELAKIEFFKDKFVRDINRIMKRFPDFESLDNFYKELLLTYGFTFDEIKKLFARLVFIKNKISDLAENSQVKIKRTRNINSIKFIMGKYLGRVSSLMKRNRGYFLRLDELRKVLNRMPNLLDMFTVIIAGFPNVGKSTLLKRLCGSNVDIESYPFTTKNLMLGYLKVFERRAVQLVDTPGLLGRDKSNFIERRAWAILKRGNLIVFVFDLTESCGYLLDNQIRLFRRIKKLGKPMVIYFSKADLFEDYHSELKDNIVKRFPEVNYFSDVSALRDFIFRYLKDNISK